MIRELRAKSTQGFYQLVAEHSGEELLKAIRQGNADLLSRADYALTLEFDLECLRNESLRQGNVELEDELLEQARELLQKMKEKCDMGTILAPDDFLISLWSFGRGLVIRQLLLQPTVTQEDTRRMMNAFFDLVTAHPNPKSKRNPTT